MSALIRELRRLAPWMWIVEAGGVALVAGAAFTGGYPQALELALGTALLLALPLGLVQHALEKQLVATIRTAVSDSVAAASSRRLSGQPGPIDPEDLELWPFAAVTEPAAAGQIQLRLISNAATESSLQPIEAMVVVTDPVGRTFNVDERLHGRVEKTVVTWQWPDNFTSGDIRPGVHTVEFFVAPLSAGPARRLGLAAQAEFEYPRPNEGGPTAAA